LKKIRILIFVMVSLGFGSSLGLQGKPRLVPLVYAGPQNPPKTPETEIRVPEKSLGTQEIPRTDGGRDKIYYSITTLEEERKSREEEKEKADKSWEMLNNIIIDRRSR
jgi:hypothetical protein